MLEALNASLLSLEEWLAKHIDHTLFLDNQLRDQALATTLAILSTLTGLDLKAALTDIVSLVARESTSGDV